MTEKWLKLILCVSIVIFLLPLSVPSISPINNEFNDNSRDYITSENQAINTVEKSTINHNELDDDGLNSNADAGSQLIIQPVPASEIPIFANNDPVIDTRASRNVRVNHVNTGSNDPNAGATPFSANNSILVGSLKGNELHWFYTQALKSPSIGKIYNFTLSPTLLSSFVNDDWLLVRIYMHWNFDEDWEDKIDDPTKIDDKEMILLHQESYDWSSSTHTVSFAHTSDAVDYYVCVEGQPKDSESTLSYELTTTWYKITPPTDGIYDNENNYKLEKSTLISPYMPVKNKMIDMDHQAIDWYHLRAPSAPPDTDLLGINVTVSLDIKRSSNSYTDTDSIAAFVVELNTVILHETQGEDLIFGGVGNASKHSGIINKHSTVPIEKGLRDFYHAHFYPPGSSDSDKIVNSYIGVFAVTYGIDLKTDQHRFHDSDLDFEVEDAFVNGWLEYSFNTSRSEPIVWPHLTAKVYSLRTNTAYGRTYDKFKYHIFYTNPANYGPLASKMKIYIPLGQNNLPIIEDLLEVDPDNTKYMYPPAEYYVIIDGIRLREGDHKFQVICHDKHIYAKGAKCDKVFYNGPFITDNIGPQVRLTAPSTIVMYEDDLPMDVELDTIFEDVNGDQIHSYIQNNEDGLEKQDKLDSVFLRILNNEKFRIEPLLNKYGNNIITLEASDLIWPMVNATHRLEITVLPVNDPPRIKTPFNKKFFFGEIRFDEDSSFSNLNLNDIFIDDVEFDPIEFTYTGNKNVKININETGYVTFAAIENWSGREDITFIATDLPGGVASDVLKVVVEPVNDAPVMNKTYNIICHEETWTNFTFGAWDPADHDPLEFSTNIALEIGLNEDEFSFNTKTGELNLYPPNRVATGKTYLVTLRVRDIPNPEAGDPIEVSMKVNFTIRNTWDKPSCQIIEPKNSDRFLHIELIDFRGICYDDDMSVKGLNEEITYEWYSNVDGPIGDSDVERDILLSAGADGTEHVITLKVSDGKEVAWDTIRIYVLKENQKRDTDKDGMPDYWEVRNNLDKLNEDDAHQDPDQDEFTNFEEWTYGLDGKEATTDPTDPWDPDSYPKDVFRPDEKESTEEDYFVPLALLSIIIIVAVVIIIITYLFVSQRVVVARRYAERRYELEKMREKRELEAQEAELKYGVYKAKKQNVLCHKCGHRNKIKSTSRPLAVKCSQCDTRGVVY